MTGDVQVCGTGVRGCGGTEVRGYGGTEVRRYGWGRAWCEGGDQRSGVGTTYGWRSSVHSPSVGCATLQVWPCICLM